MYRMPIFSDTRNHAPTSPATRTASPPHVHASPTTAPRVSLSRSLARPLHTNQHVSDQGKRVWNEWKPSPSSSRKFSSPLLLSLSVSFLSLVPLVISFLVLYPLYCSLYWRTYRHSSTLMIKLEAIIDSISCCRVWQWEAWDREGGGGGRERERERERNEDWELRMIHK